MPPPIQQIIDIRATGQESWERMTKASSAYLAKQQELVRRGLQPAIRSATETVKRFDRFKRALDAGRISQAEFRRHISATEEALAPALRTLSGFDRATRLTSASLRACAERMLLTAKETGALEKGTKKAREELREQIRALYVQSRRLKEAEMRSRDLAGSQFGMMRHTEQATYALNAMSAAAHGAMLGMSLARGQIMGAAFSVIFLRFSVVKLVLQFAAFTAAIFIAQRILTGVVGTFIYFGRETPRVMMRVGRLQREWGRALRDIRRALRPLMYEGIIPLIDALRSLIPHFVRLARVGVWVANRLAPLLKVLAWLISSSEYLAWIVRVLLVSALGVLGFAAFRAIRVGIRFLISALATQSKAAEASIKLFKDLAAVMRGTFLATARLGWLFGKLGVALGYLGRFIRFLLPFFRSFYRILGIIAFPLLIWDSVMTGLNKTLSTVVKVLRILGNVMVMVGIALAPFTGGWSLLVTVFGGLLNLVSAVLEKLGFSPGLGDLIVKLWRFMFRFLNPSFRALLFVFKGLNVWAKILAPALYGIHVALAWLKRGTEETTKEMKISEIKLPDWMISTEWWEKKFRPVWRWMIRFYEEKIPLWMKSSYWWTGKFINIYESLPEWMRSASWWEETVFREVKAWWEAFIEFLPLWMRSARWWIEHIPSWTEIWVVLPLWMKSARWWSENVWGEVKRWWNRFYEFLPDWMKDIGWWRTRVTDILEGLPEWMKSADWWQTTVFRFVKNWWEGFLDFLPEFMKSARWWRYNLLGPWELLFLGLPEWLWDDIWWRDTVFGFVKAWWDKFLDFLPEWMKSADWWRRNLLSSWNLFSSLPEWMRSADWWKRNVIDPIKEAWKEFAEWVRNLLPSMTLDFGFFAEGAERGIQALEVSTRKFVARAEATVRATQRALASVRALPGMTEELIEQYFRPPIAVGGAPQGGAQRGAIVTRPTTLRVGEAGPEAIIPLRRRGAIPSIVINITGNYILDEPTARTLADAVSSTIMRKLHTHYPYSIGR